jgi:hypothetical protein
MTAIDNKEVYKKIDINKRLFYNEVYLKWLMIF